MSNLRFAFRQLLRSPGFTTVALATLALCIGANLAIFAVVDAILIRSLPYDDADRLVTMRQTYSNANIPSAGSSLTTYYERRGQIDALSSIGAINLAGLVIGESGATSREPVGRVSPDFFLTLGIKPILGRAFLEEEMTYQTDHVCMLSHEYWQSHYNSDRDIVGKSVRVDGIPRVVVGVLPPDSRFLSFDATIWMPLSSDQNERGIEARHSPGMILIGRLAPGATIEQAQAQIDAHDQAIAPLFPQAKLVTDAGYRSVVKSLHGEHVAEVRPTLLLLQAGALLVLLIGLVNLVNLLLIRASGKSQELAIRQSLGAGHRHIVAHVLSETMLLTLTGGALGIVLAMGGIRLLEWIGADRLPLSSRIQFDSRLAMIAMLGTLVLGAILALPTVWFNLRGQLGVALRSVSRGGTVGLAAQRLRHGFIVAQIALAFILLAGAGLVGLSLKKVMDVTPGFQSQRVLTGQVYFPWNDYRDPASFVTFSNRLLESLEGHSGVVSVGLSTDVPMREVANREMVMIAGRELPKGPPILHAPIAVGGDYFEAMGIPLIEGRYLDQSDSQRSEQTCVVDETFARQYWPNGGAIGQQVYRGDEITEGELPFTIVGVVGDIKQASLTETGASGAIYYPFSRYFSRAYFVVVRTASQDPIAFASTLQTHVRNIDPEMPLMDVRTMDLRIADTLVTRRSPAVLIGGFAALALLLAAIGTYGVLSYAVSQRKREIGVRMAMGAMPAQIRKQFLAMGMRLLVVGLALGILGAWASGRLIQGILFDVPAFHFSILLLTAMTMGVVATVSCLLPSQRAARISPMEALRHE